MEGMDQRGNPLPIYGGGQGRKRRRRRGALSPLSQWHRNVAGAIIMTTTYTNNFAAVITNSLPLYAAV
jgi:hypothetical protein